MMGLLRPLARKPAMAADTVQRRRDVKPKLKLNLKLNLKLSAINHAGLAATIAMVLLLCALQALALLRAPAAWLPSSITVRLAAGQTLTLGRQTLAAPQADREHLALARDAHGDWLLRNLSANRQLLLLSEGSERRLGSTPLHSGQRFQIDSALFTVKATNASAIEFGRDGHSWRYDGALLYRDGQAQPSCPGSHAGARLLSFWNRQLPSALSIARPLSFGGSLHCDNRLGLPQLPPATAQIGRVGGALVLTAGRPDGEQAAVLLHDGDTLTDLRRQQVSLAGVKAIVVGHTRFQLTIAGDQLTLLPSRHVTLFTVPERHLPEALSWQWQQRSVWHNEHSSLLWTGIAAALLCMAVSVVNKLAGGQRAPYRAHPGLMVLASCAILAGGLAALLAQRAGDAPSAAGSLGLATSALLLWLALPGRLTLATAAGVVLLATGLLSQLELGLGAPESSWLRYYQKSAALLAFGTGLGGLLRLWVQQQRARGAHLPQRSIEWMLAIFATVALAALAVQVLWGDETGVFDLQPVELAKLALTALTAHCLALRFSWHAGPRDLSAHSARWLQLIAPALLFLALLGLALVQVDDFSPLILLLVWSTAMLLAYALAAGNRWLSSAAVGLALAAAAAIITLRWLGSDDLIRWGFYADRFLVWLHPTEHPHTGQQLLQGARAISEGGWLGSDRWLGLRSLGMGAGNALHIPAVQDDFAATFFLNRHGLIGALLLWLAQAAFLAGIALTAARASRYGKAARNFRQAWYGRFSYFALCGGGALVLGHFLLAWGTNLAIFPIMGQPMSFLSAGGSHLLFFLCPLLAFSAISAQSSEGE